MNPAEDIDALVASLPFFQRLSGTHIRLLAESAAPVACGDGRFIFREGQAADRFYVIQEGRVSLEVFEPSRGSLALQVLNPPDVLGYSWLFPPYKWQFDARAATAVRALSFDAARVLQACERDHELGYQLLRRFGEVAVKRLQATRIQLLDIYGHAHTS